ncbi:MAG: adenylate/guanylate cyclase domain-containing protein [Desulfobacterales bacterium]|nr:adenylate/guanylate cyclase domain-containing protein [Desulfobacterales bacterium]
MTKCPLCQTRIEPDEAYCSQCGHKREATCPACTHPTPPNYKFCGHCGHDLGRASAGTPGALSPDEKLRKIKRYLPDGLSAKILAQKSKIEGERKLVTVMFCDMAGFTPISEKIGPESAYAVMDQVYEILINKVHELEGTVNEMTGDGIMALFGAPIAYEDAPQRAIRASLGIHREIVRFSERMQRDLREMSPIRMRIGIHTGPVVVGTLGNDLRVEFKAVGDTVNLASRVEGLAQPGTTVVTAATYALTEGFFRFEALGPCRLEGKTGPVQTYRVIAPSSRRTRFDVSAERGLTPFVGRRSELELMLDSFERIKTGRGQAFSIISEAGLGKSRLLYEFRKAIANEDVHLLEGKCLSFSKGIAFHPVIDILKSIFRITDEDPDSERIRKVDSGLAPINVDPEATRPYVLDLLSVRDSGLEQAQMSPDAKKERITEALRMILLKLSRRRPLVIAIEDLHWVDRNSEEIFAYILKSIPGYRIMLIFTFRPEFRPQWGTRSYHSQLTLNRLANRHVIAMMKHLLENASFDLQLEKLIIDKTEGVPFFIEEFILSLKNLNIIERNSVAYHLTARINEVAIPSTIQDIIMARIDALPPPTKEILQIGSVIEREFSYVMIKTITALPDMELSNHIAILKDAELIYERRTFPQTTYLFKHALTREVVYEAIVGTKKGRLHHKVGKALEALYPQELNEYASVLASHFIQSGQLAKGAEYLRRASKRAEESASLNDAIAFARQRVKALEALAPDASVENQIIEARTSLGLYTSQTGRLGEAREAIAPVIARAVRKGDNRRLAQIYTILGTHHYMFEEAFEPAFQDLGKALRLAEETNEIIVTVLANYYLGVAYTFDCQFDRAIEHIKNALYINSAVKNLWGMSVMQSHLSLPYNYSGQIRTGFRHSEEAVRLAEESGDIFSKAMAYTLHGFSCYYMGRFPEAIFNLTQGATLGERMNYFAWNAVSQYYLGESHFAMGHYGQAQSFFESAIWFLQNNIWFPSFKNFNRIALAHTQLRHRSQEIHLKPLCRHAVENRLKLFAGQAQRKIGHILMIQSGRRQLPKAEKWIRGAIETNRRNGVKFELGQDHVLLAAYFRRRGNQTRARQCLQYARELFRACEVEAWIKPSEATVEDMGAGRG